MERELIVAVCVGLGLAAACGFRIFVPLLILNLAAGSGQVSLAGNFDWIASRPALVAFAVATVLEIAAYYVPWLDNLLDTIATPAAVVAGTVVTASVVVGIDPFLKWTLAVIAGGGVAGVVQSVTSGARGFSSVTTAGFGNPVVSSLELGGALGMSVAAVFVPLLAAGLAAVLVVALWLRRRSSRRAAAA